MYAFCGSWDMLVAALLPPISLPMDVWVQLTDWQIVFLYLLPMMDRNLHELEALAEQAKQHG